MSTWSQHASFNRLEVNEHSKSREVEDGLGEINHTSALSGDFGQLFNQSEHSDIELIVESEHFYAHRVILAARSEYFRALLYGGLRESQQNNHTIEIKECQAEAFRILLLYIYTGKINLIKEKEDVLLDLLALVHQYGFEDLENSLSIYLKSILSSDNVCLIYDTSCLYELNYLQQYCARFIDHHANEIIQSNEFLSLSSVAFSSIISRDSFYCSEIEIFNAVKTWHEFFYRNDDQQWKPIEEIISKVRLALLSIDELLKIVRYANLFDLNAIIDAIEIIHTEQTKKNYRGRLRFNENIATKSYQAQVIEGNILLDTIGGIFPLGERELALLDGDVTNYDLDHGYTRHLIDDTHRICVKLDGPSIINHIKLLLWDKDPRVYSYYIEVSVDGNSWTRIIDYRAYLCRSWQRLYFPPIVASYIRVVGTHNSVNKVFHLVSLEVYYKEKSFVLIEDIHVPTENVAIIENNAVVSEGVSRVRNALINGDYQSYDWDTGYTCHQIGSSGIVIQLSQPYIIGSMRLLLWDCDNRSYSYYIETSCDNINWTKVVDRQKVACRSWQILTFSPRIVVFIRICGTQNTANEVFHCVHFECPCQPDVLQSHTNEDNSNSTIPDTAITYADYSKHLFEITKKSTSTIDKNSLIQTQTILPFTIQPNSSSIFPHPTCVMEF